MERFCLDCSALLKGRIDKKFCDDQCRSNHNHKLKAKDHSLINRINQILKKNRSILKDKCPSGKAKVKKAMLIRDGFNFEFHTHFYLNKSSETYYFCYEYGYLDLINGEVLVVKEVEK